MAGLAGKNALMSMQREPAVHDSPQTIKRTRWGMDCPTQTLLRVILTVEDTNLFVKLIMKTAIQLTTKVASERGTPDTDHFGL